MSPQADSIRVTLDKWDEKVFCGRDQELMLFRDALMHASEATSVIAISGIGGVGKSTLVRAYIRHAISNSAVVGLISADNFASPTTILIELSNQICADRRTKAYFSQFLRDVDRLHRIEATLLGKGARDNDETTVGKVTIEATKGGVASSVGAVVGTAIAGPPGAIAGGALGGALMPLVEAASQALGRTFSAKGLSKTDAEFFTASEKYLTNSFLQAVNSLAADDYKVVLLFDAIEYLGETIRWLRDELLAGLRNTGIVVVLAGRYTLPRNEWLKWTLRLKEIELPPFSKSATEEYLSRYGISDTTVREFIHEQAAGLPLAVALLASYAAHIKLENSRHLLPSTVETSQVINTVIDSLLQNLPDEKLREVLCAASIPRWFNAELLAQLLDGTTADREYGLLSNLRPAVRFRPKGLSLHDNVREYLSRSMGLRSPNRYRALHEVAKNYFADLKAQIEMTGNIYGEEWQIVALEWVYHHLLLGNLEVFTDEIERSSRFYQHSYARRLIADVETYQKSVQGIARIYAYYKGQNLIHHNDFESAIEIFKSILDSDELEDGEFHDLVSYQLGKAYYWRGHISQAETYLKKALERFMASNNIRMQSHASIFLSRVSEAMHSPRQAIAWRLRALRCIRLLLNNPKDTDRYNRDYADRLFSLGEALRLRNSIEAALAIHMRCLEARKRLANDHDVGESHIAIAKCLLKLCRYDDTEANLRRAVTIFESTNDLYVLGDIRLLLGQQFLMQGNMARAAIEFEQAARLAKESQHMRCLTEATSLLGRVASLGQNAG